MFRAAPPGQVSAHAGADTRGSHGLQQAHDGRVGHTGPVLGQQAVDRAVTPVVLELIGHRRGALDVGGVEPPPAPVGVGRSQPGLDVLPPHAVGGIANPR